MVAFVLFGFLSWFIGNNQDAEWVRSVFAPDYEPTMAIIEEMLYEGRAIDTSDPEFEQMLAFFESSFISSSFFASIPPLAPISERSTQQLGGFQEVTPYGEIIEIRIILGNGYIFGNAGDNPSYDVEYAYEEGRSYTISGIFWQEIKDSLQGKYLQEPLWRWKNIMFSLGVVLSFGFLYNSWILPGDSAPKEVGKDFILFWIFAAITGFFFGTTLSSVLNIYYQWISIGISILLLQWLILRTQILRARRWIYANIIGFILVFIFQKFLLEFVFEKYRDQTLMNENFDVFLTGARLLSILFIVIPQWFILKRYFYRAGWWILIGIGVSLVEIQLYFIVFEIFTTLTVQELSAMSGLFPLVLESATLGTVLYWLLINNKREIATA